VGPIWPKIFIVDDDNAVRESLRALLESYGFDVEDYRSGPAFLGRYRPDMRGCLLLDMHLPEMNGLEILTKLRTEIGSDMPVVMITGRSDKPTKARLLAAGATSHLEKPLDSDHLLATIQALTAV
jgi:FixJ family two-component response regulator